MSYNAGDILTNAVPIEVDYKNYDGKLAIKCFTKSSERHFVSSPGENKKKGDRVKKETINVVEPFFLPVAFLFGCKLGEYVRLEFLSGEYVHQKGSNRIVEVSTGKNYDVTYPEDFRKTGICSLRGWGKSYPETKEYYSKRLDKKIVQEYFALKKVPEIEKGKEKLVFKPILVPGELTMIAQYYVTTVYKKSRKWRSIFRSKLTDGWIERSMNGMEHVKSVISVWVMYEGVSAKFNLNLLKHVNKV